MREDAPAFWLDSRDLAKRFGKRHHNMLASIDQIVARCPAAASHFLFETYPVNAGLGGTRRVRRALVDRTGFALLAMSLSLSRCDAVFEVLSSLEIQNRTPSHEK